MTSSRRVELGCGLAAGILGLFALGFALFAPLGTSTRSCTTSVSSSGVVTTDCSKAGTTHISIVQSQGFVSVLPAVVLFGTILIAIAVFAAMHSLRRAGVFLAFLWIFTVLLLLAMVLAILSIGVFFVPSALLAIAAAVAGSLAAARKAPLPGGASPV